MSDFLRSDELTYAELDAAVGELLEILGEYVPERDWPKIALRLGRAVGGVSSG